MQQKTNKNIKTEKVEVKKPGRQARDENAEPRVQADIVALRSYHRSWCTPSAVQRSVQVNTVIRSVTRNGHIICATTSHVEDPPYVKPRSA